MADLGQFGHLGAAAEGIQLRQQGTELLLLGGLLAPAAQQVVGVQQDVQAFGEEAVDQLRITAFAGITLARRFGRGQAFLMQSLNPCEKRRRTVDRRQGLAF